MKRRGSPQVLALAVMAAMSLLACASVPAGSPVPVASPSRAAAAASSAASPAGSAVSSPTVAASASAAAVTPIPGCLPECVPGSLTRPGNLPAGDYTTQHFFGGQLTVTVPEGWMSFEDSTGEFALQPIASETRKLLFWIDIYPIIDPTPQPVPGVEPTANGMLEWLEANPNVDVSERSSGTIGGIPAEVVNLTRSDDATNVDPGCPDDGGRPCVGLFGFPQWEYFYSQGGPFLLRLFAADVTWGGQDHTVYALVEAGDAEELEAFASVATPLIEGARLPAGVEPKR